MPRANAASFVAPITVSAACIVGYSAARDRVAGNAAGDAAKTGRTAGTGRRDGYVFAPTADSKIRETIRRPGACAMRSGRTEPAAGTRLIQVKRAPKCACYK